MKHKRSAIIAAAVTLIDREGVGISTARVAAEAGVSNGTLFNYFPTKQALIDSVYVEVKRDLIAALGEHPTDTTVEDVMRVLWARWIEWADADPARHRVALMLSGADLVSAEASATMDAQFAPFFAGLAQAQADGTLCDFPVGYLVAVLRTHLDLTIASDLDPDERVAAFDLAWRAITRS